MENQGSNEHTGATYEPMNIAAAGEGSANLKKSQFKILSSGSKQKGFLSEVSGSNEPTLEQRTAGKVNIRDQSEYEFITSQDKI